MYVITTDSSGVIRINGEICTRADFRKKWARGKTAWYCLGFDPAPLEKIMQAEDEAWCGSMGGTPSYTFKVHRDGAFQVMPFTLWGVEERETRKAAMLFQDLQDACSELEGGAGRTLASTAGRVLRVQVPKDHLHQLAPQFRALAQGAIHQGPTVCLRGGCSEAVEWDRTAAFLHGMRRPVPVAWAPWPGASWEELRDLPDDGLIRATVYLDPARWVGTLPPLPVRTSGGTVYPVGRIRGAWTIALLRQAYQLGAEVEEIHECALAACFPIHAPAADRIDRIKHEKLRKALYTRYWGRLAGKGGYEGTIAKLFETDVKLGTSDLWWRWVGRTVAGPCAPDWSPAHAAFIAGSNHLAMNETIATLPPGALVAAHVDALWIDASRCDVGSVPPGFREKRRGTLRFYTTGTYNHSGECHAQGCPDDMTPQSLEMWAQGSNCSDQHWIRAWRGRSARWDVEAESDPPVHSGGNLQPLPDVPLCTELDCWSNGWPAEEWRERLEKMSILEVW